MEKSKAQYEATIKDLTDRLNEKDKETDGLSQQFHEVDQKFKLMKKKYKILKEANEDIAK